MELLECINVNKSFGEKHVLKNVNIKIQRGKIIGLLGKNGTGKSTIAKAIEKKENLTIQEGFNIDDYEIKVYDEAFVRDTIVNAIDPRNPDKDIPGVFTISEGNGKIEKEISKTGVVIYEK